MSQFSLLQALIFTISIALIIPSEAQDTPQDYLHAHNTARAALGIGPLKWDNKLAAYSHNYLNQHKSDCQLVHSNGPYGENLAWDSGDFSAIDAVQMWVGEKPYYNYYHNSCTQGQMCGHYTQVVWRNSVRVGCSKVRCNNGGTLIGCNYDPPGNFIGQRPY